MAHQKRVIDFALFFYALFNSPIISWRFILPGQTGTTAGQIGTLIAACQNIAYLVVTFGWE